MKIKDIIKLFNLKTLYMPENFEEEEIQHAGASDLMSDVLANSRENQILITGLTSPQTVTTAAVIGAKGIIFVRGKEISKEVINAAEELEIPIFQTSVSMFVVCAELYVNGVRDVMDTHKMLNKE